MHYQKKNTSFLEYVLSYSQCPGSQMILDERMTLICDLWKLTMALWVFNVVKIKTTPIFFLCVKIHIILTFVCHKCYTSSVFVPGLTISKRCLRNPWPPWSGRGTASDRVSWPRAWIPPGCTAEGSRRRTGRTAAPAASASPRSAAGGSPPTAFWWRGERRRWRGRFRAGRWIWCGCPCRTGGAAGWRRRRRGRSCCCWASTWRSRRRRRCSRAGIYLRDVKKTNSEAEKRFYFIIIIYIVKDFGPVHQRSLSVGGNVNL